MRNTYNSGMPAAKNGFALKVFRVHIRAKYVYLMYNNTI